MKKTVLKQITTSNQSTISLIKCRIPHTSTWFVKETDKGGKITVHVEYLHLSEARQMFENLVEKNEQKGV